MLDIRISLIASFLLKLLWIVSFVGICELFELHHVALVSEVENIRRRNDFPEIDVIFLNENKVTMQYFSRFLKRNSLFERTS